MADNEEAKQTIPKPPHHVHGEKGVFCGGDWVPIEECADWVCPKQCAKSPQPVQLDDKSTVYDVAIIGAGCVGAAIARELSRYDLKTILLERDDDVTQGSTKGNSGIIHSGYDDKSGSIKSKFCWRGNQMFPELDRQLKFGYLQNGSLVIARSKEEFQHLKVLYKRGQRNKVRNLRIIEKEELHAMEPHLGDDCIAALYSPDAGIVTPYEYTIALAENAAQNGVQIRTRHEVHAISQDHQGRFKILVKNWAYAATSDPSNVRIDNSTRRVFSDPVSVNEILQDVFLIVTICMAAVVFMGIGDENRLPFALLAGSLAAGTLGYVVYNKWLLKQGKDKLFSTYPSDDVFCRYEEMDADKIICSRYVVNCAGLFSDKVANMIGDYSFKIKPRIGDYLLFEKLQGDLAKCTLFPCPDPKLGKGVVVQRTLWGNLILGPTSRDVDNPQTQEDTAEDIMKYILTKSKQLVPAIDANNVMHSFAGARAKSDTGDWIIEKTKCKDINFYNVAGIDSPGLAGSPAIAVHVVRQLLAKQGQLELKKNKSFNPYRRPLIFPKKGWSGLKLKRVVKNINELTLSTDEAVLKKNVVCKCEKVTEFEILDAMDRCGASVDTTQAIRRRTRAGMGQCQASPDNCDCELYVAQLIAKKKGMPLSEVGRRPWPATSLFKRRWLSDEEKASIDALVK
eukprot:488710_1